MNFLEFYLCFHNSCEILLSFSRAPGGIVFGVITDIIISIALEKNVKKNAILFKLFWYKVFVH